MILRRRVVNGMFRPLLLALVVLASFAVPVRAQRPSNTAALSAEARAHLVLADTTIRTARIPGGRIDLNDGVVRAVYRLHFDLEALASPEATARAYLRKTASAFGWTPDLGNLEFESITEAPGSRHVIFRQTFRGIPVAGRRVKVNLDRKGQPSMVLSAYAPELDARMPFDPRPSVSASRVADVVREAVIPGGGQIGTAELVVVPDAHPRLAWRVLAWPADAIAEWNVLVDAHTGSLIRVTDQRVREHHEQTFPARVSKNADSDASSPAILRRLTGSGYVFDPDPLSTSGQTYVPPYVDADDADNAALDAERILVDLPDITQSTDLLYRLEGPFVRIEGPFVFGGRSVGAPAESSPDGFRYTRSESGFEAVMAYYHIDKSQRHVQALGFFDRQNNALPVNPRKSTEDNSFFLPGANKIELGTGGVDDAEDSFVIWHEYGHALLEAGAPDLLGTPEGQALHEGWADYWAASYSRGLIEQGLSKRQDWQQIFKWDAGDGSPDLWGGRRLDNAGHYPEDVPCSRNSPLCDIWHEGDLWATSLMEVYDVLGRTVTDQLNLYSHAYLLPPVTMGDAAEAIIQADLDHFGGEHVAFLLDRFGARGLVDINKFGPQIVHQPLVATEQLGGTLHIEVSVTSATSVDTVRVVFGTTTTPDATLLLSPGIAGNFSGDVPLPDQAGTLYYFVEAIDNLGRSSRLPTSGNFSFAFGPDLEPPTVTHTPITSRPLAAWPAELVATVTDNLGIDSVWASFSVDSPDGIETTSGAFGMAPVESSYRGLFPVPVGELQLGSRIHYQVHARDRALAANETVLPETGSYAFPITARGVLQEFDFESPGPTLVATGVWARGEPTFGLSVAHSGRFVWATDPGGAYPDIGSLSSLEMPALNLTGQTQAFLVFWHWYDFEHNGLVQPGRVHSGQIMRDGANVKVSTDGGITWNLVVPEDGYSGTVFDAPENPLGNEAAFGGFSFGWRREIIPLPTNADVRIRFDFGTDNDNSDVAISYAGWAIDDVMVTTKHPTDSVAPVLFSDVPAFSVEAARTDPPPFAVNAGDDTGIADALVPYTLSTESGVTVDTLRLAMMSTDASVFEGSIVLPAGPRPGDEITYRILLRDFSGNEALFPAASDAAARIEYRLIDEASALTGVRASGLWRPVGSTFVADTGKPSPERSTLVLSPIDLPTNAAGLSLSLSHRYVIASGAGGNLKVSLDDGASWSVLSPEGGYGATFTSGTTHPMKGEAIFGGASEGVEANTFDLASYAGKQIRLRVDFGTSRTLGDGEFWEIREATLSESTVEDAFETPRELRLLPNFPDPFSALTTISYTIPETMPVNLAVFDILGRRVAVLTDTVNGPGTYTVSFDGARLAGGVYLLRLRAGGMQKMERMVIAH